MSASNEFNFGTLYESSNELKENWKLIWESGEEFDSSKFPDGIPMTVKLGNKAIDRIEQRRYKIHTYIQPDFRNEKGILIVNFMNSIGQISSWNNYSPELFGLKIVHKTKIGEVK